MVNKAIDNRGYVVYNKASPSIVVRLLNYYHSITISLCALIWSMQTLLKIPYYLFLWVSVLSLHAAVHSILQMCDRLGIVESDYFGLQYLDRSSGCNIWLNKRHQVRHQCGKPGSPYQLKFAIRFYTDPELLLQPTTMWVCTIKPLIKDLSTREGK